MPNSNEICNLALSRCIGANLISSLASDTSREAELCRAIYPIAKNSMLSEMDFSFARKQLVLALLVEKLPQYSYSYKMPADCLVAREIYNELQFLGQPSQNLYAQNPQVQFAPYQKIPFSIGLGIEGDYQTVNTNQAQAQLIYTADIQNDSLMPFLVADALAWRIAAELAVPIKGDTTLQDSHTKKYLAAAGLAKQRNADQDYEPPPNFSTYADARL